MQIISSFRDYYDSARSAGFDSDLAWRREQLCYAVSEVPAGPLAELVQKLRIPRAQHQRIKVRAKGWADVRIYFGVIVFVGQVFPFIKVELTTRGYAGDLYSSSTEDKFIYSEQEWNELLQGELEGLLAQRGSSQLGYFASWDKAAVRQFWGLASIDLKQWSDHNNLPLVALTPYQSDRQVQVCPVLSMYQFFRVIHPWQAYQALYMFLSNQANPERSVVTASDKDRVAKHGFDDWSFRKLPTKRRL